MFRYRRKGVILLTVTLLLYNTSCSNEIKSKILYYTQIYGNGCIK